ncbi:hypothetical protein QR665_11290 [Acinetobacter gerneri]|nr:hypothetical protein [Acinetobacter gerneri]MDV2440050.1 hypothetical protein [Acinetobacter gerneri]
MSINEAQLLADEAKYCSHGDTVHYVNPPADSNPKCNTLVVS